jgi:phosphoglycerate dehydrogenase-like enzyme
VGGGRVKIAILCKTEIHIQHLVERLRPWDATVCRTKEQLQAAIPDADVLIALNQGFHYGVIDAGMLATARRLKFIQHYGVATDATDVEAATKRGIRVATQPGQNSRSVAEQSLFLLLALGRQMPMGQRLLREGRMGEAPCVELAGKTLCIVGLGIIGKMLVEMGRGLSMNVIGVRRNPKTDDLAGTGISKVHGTNELHAALAAADFTILLLPLNPETFDLIGDEEFRVMKRTGMLINMSRGPHVNREALERALDAGEIAGFASDVYWTEPADPADPLLGDERVIITPHLGGSAVECIQRTVDRIHANLTRFERNEPLESLVN